MADKPRLSGAIEDFLLFRKAEGKSPSTIRNDRMVLRRLLLTTGDLFMSGIGEKHINAHLAVAAESRSGATLGIDYATLSQFFQWAVRNRLIGRFSNPMEGRKAPKSMPRERERVHMKDFPRLLDAAESHHRRDRMVVALGLYLFLRGSEVTTLRLSDVRLDDGEIFVRVWKTKQVDRMPISPDLDRELRQWLAWYAQDAGPLDPSWYLVPAKKRNATARDPDTGRLVAVNLPARLSPTRRIVKIEDIPQRALSLIGFRLREDSGESRREGMHTLRRSGARARFDTLLARGFDGAMREVQTLLHHSSMAQTEHYLGLSLDVVKRNDSVRSGPMFGTDDNVVSIHDTRRGTGG